MCLLLVADVFIDAVDVEVLFVERQAVKGFHSEHVLKYNLCSFEEYVLVSVAEV